MEFSPHFFVIKKVSTKKKQKTPHRYYSSLISVLSRKNPPTWNLLRQVGMVFLPPVTRNLKEVKNFLWNMAQATTLLAAVSNNFAVEFIVQIQSKSKLFCSILQRKGKNSWKNRESNPNLYNSARLTASYDNLLSKLIWFVKPNKLQNKKAVTTPWRFANHEHPFQKHSETEPKPACYLLYWCFQKRKRWPTINPEKWEWGTTDVWCIFRKEKWN